MPVIGVLAFVCGLSCGRKILAWQVLGAFVDVKLMFWQNQPVKPMI